jgi:hypothetical protein
MPPSMPPTYSSGEHIRAGDHVLYHGERGKVEFVAAADDPDTQWYIEQCADGCMVLAPSFGRVYVTATEHDEDLQFVSRREPRPGA